MEKGFTVILIGVCIATGLSAMEGLARNFP